MREYADQRRQSKTSDMKVGDTVLAQQPKTNKLSTPFNPHPYKVVARKGRMVTAERGSHKITRNLSFFKKIESIPIPENETDGKVDDPIPNASDHQEETIVPLLPRRFQRQRLPPNRLAYR